MRKLQLHVSFLLSMAMCGIRRRERTRDIDDAETVGTIAELITGERK